MNHTTLDTFRKLARKESDLQSNEIFYFTLCAEMLTALEEPTEFKQQAKKDIKNVFAEAVKLCDTNIRAMKVSRQLAKTMTKSEAEIFTNDMRQKFWKLAGDLTDASDATIPEVLFLMQAQFQIMDTRTSKWYCQKLNNLAKRASKHYPKISESQMLEIVTNHKNALQSSEAYFEITE